MCVVVQHGWSTLCSVFVWELADEGGHFHDLVALMRTETIGVEFRGACSIVDITFV